ncbi:hypothetical protein HFO56_02935 [Rhizobium laguerreae]|uniref:hypothetical protein n=1 Tax=Rhizobium laguerreae TaxID=1076926 RepID=UPI001C91DB03|nr:hypothetical protein [Rhizobium laguerreae]MBY3151342.1 hypothetical protein [Rhizobium laguerreae]
MKFAKLHRIGSNEGWLNLLMGLAIEAIFIAVPMTCMAVVLYDISLNGMHSVFSIIGCCIFGVWAVFRAVTFCMGKFDSWYEGFYARRKARTRRR